jgi:5-methylcytosine-specific restriction enzyme A
MLYDRPRRDFPSRVKKEAWKRAGGVCEGEGCGCSLVDRDGRPFGKHAFDHVLPDQMGGEPILDNCKVLCLPCHKIKTKQDAANIAKAKRIELKRINAVTTRRPLQSAGFPKAPPQHRATRPLERPLPPRRWT